MKSLRILLVALLTGWSTLSCTLDGFLFNPKELQEYALPENTIPDGLLTQVSLQSGKNTIYGYWVASNGERPGLTVLYCHGNRYHMDHYWDRVMMLHELGMNIFIFDYRGFGLSEGEASELGMYADAEAALSYVISEQNVPEDSLAIYGYSLGNVASIYLAAKLSNPLCLIAEAPFASSTSLAQGALSLDIPAGWLTEGEFDNAEKIQQINTPFLLLHGTMDDFVRYRDNGSVIYERAPEPKMRIIIEGANHTNIPRTIGVKTYQELILDWILTYSGRS